MAPHDPDDAEGIPPDLEAEATELPECDPEFIDGSYYGCGACRPCLEDEQERQQRRFEMGIED